MWCQSVGSTARRRLNILDFHRTAPFGCRGDCSGLGTEPDQICLVTELLAAELTDVVFTADSHLGRRGVAYMRVVRPNNGFAVRAMKRQQILQRLEHVAVAQVP
jgi:hypothetical protein